jgi:hypothetical protein
MLYGFDFKAVIKAPEWRQPEPSPCNDSITAEAPLTAAVLLLLAEKKKRSRQRAAKSDK